MPMPSHPSAAGRAPRRRRRLARAAAAALLLAAIGLFVLVRYAGGLPDFREYEAGPERKSRFLAYLGPLVREENARILERRERLVAIAEKDGPGWLDRRWLRRLGRDYADDAEEMEIEALIELLLRRVDAVPAGLALAQAAKESGWGTSRFARKGNSLFGERCFEPGCGLLPRARRAGARHEVSAFDTPRESVRSYLHNINTHRSYRQLRLARARLRAQGRRLSALALVPHLGAYSERGEAYVGDIRSLILSNDLESLAVAADE